MSHPIPRDALMTDDSHRADRRAKPDASAVKFEPSAKLRARIEKLAPWRINHSSIIFDEDDFGSRGGHATVSRGEMKMTDIDMADMEKRALDKQMNRKATHDFLKKRKEMKSLGWGPGIAVKEMRIADDTDFERVLGLTMREAEFLAVLDHRNIVELEGFVEDISESIIWLVFPWADYGNLKHFIASEKWEVPERISLISDVVGGLDYLHSREPPICHGDLKSLNILVYGDARIHPYPQRVYARITDFGSARRLTERDPNTLIHKVEGQSQPAVPLSATFCASTKTITLTGNKYTLRWAAPELLLEDQLSLWSDIWALGWIAYEVMTESLPFEDVTSDFAVVERIIEGKLPSLANNAHLELIQELCSLMSMCWKTNPTERPTAGSCRRSIEKMPKFAPEMDEEIRILGLKRLRELGHLYQSRGEYAKAFGFFAEALEVSESHGSDEIFSSLHDLSQLARRRKHYSKTIALYDVVWKLYKGRKEREFDAIAGALCDLAELCRLRDQSNKTIGLSCVRPLPPGTTVLAMTSTQGSTVVSRLAPGGRAEG